MNGRMIGGGGVGKVLHYLDTMRTEVVEADRCIASLQSDNRFLVSDVITHIFAMTLLHPSTRRFSANSIFPPPSHLQRDKNKELEAKNKDMERQLADEKRLRQKAEAKYASLLQQGVGSHHENEPAPWADGDATKDNGRAAQPVHEYASEGRQIDEAQSTTYDKRQQQHPTPIRPSIPPKPLSRQNSIDEMSAARSQSVAVPQSTTGLSSVTSQFNPLGAAMPVSHGSSSAVTNAQTTTLTNHFDPLGTPFNTDPVRVPLNGVPSMPDIASNNPQPSADRAKYMVNSANARTSHFDPLGTPERPGQCLRANDAIPTMMLNGLPQIPDITSTHPPREESDDDPFDEIVRMSHSQLQDYD